MNSSTKTKESTMTRDTWDGVAAMLSSCMQCGTCTASCPNAFAMDITPRAMWRLVLTGRKEDVFRSRTFSVCSCCYTCMLRCPRGLALTDAMAGLKRIAVRENRVVFHDSAVFYTSFLSNVEKRGRVDETEFLKHYFLRLKNPLAPFRFVPLGISLLKKGKIHFFAPAKREEGKLCNLFARARERED